MCSMGVERRRQATPAQTPEGNVVMSFSFESYQLEDEECQAKEAPEKGVLTFTEPAFEESVPDDRYHGIYFAMLLAGVGFLLPYNSFITDVDYLHQKFKGSSIVFDMSLTYILVALVAVVLNNALVEMLSLHTRITAERSMLKDFVTSMPRSVRSLSALCPLSVRSLPALCQLSVRSLSALCLLSVRSLPALCPLSVNSLSALCPLSVRSLPALCPLSVRSLPALCPLSVRFLSALCLLSVRSLMLMPGTLHKTRLFPVLFYSPELSFLSEEECVGERYVFALGPLVFIGVFDVWLEKFTTRQAYVLNLMAVGVVAFGCTGTAGVIISLSRIFTKLLIKNERKNTIIFFLISIGIELMCFTLHLLVRRTQFVRYYTSLARQGLTETKGHTMESSTRYRVHHDVITEEPILDDLAEFWPQLALAQSAFETGPHHGDESSGRTALCKSKNCQASGQLMQLGVRVPPGSVVTGLDRRGLLHEAKQCGWDEGRKDNGVMGVAPIEGGIDPELAASGTYVRFDVPNPKIKRSWPSIKEMILHRYIVARVIWTYMMSIAVSYFITLCLFPGLESEIRNDMLGDWLPILVMAIFNMSDFVGKILAALPYDWKGGRLLMLSCVRVVFIPLFIMCVYPVESPALSHPAWPCIFSLLMGISNGYFGSVPMILAAGKVPPEQRELAGNTMTVSYMTGLMMGSAVAYFAYSFTIHGSSLYAEAPHNFTTSGY
ncbi:hypothetical protein JZ751_015238 [Albula glossodonta]|uniref:Equilibrative nucleoside transporter 4 n=1 Tax=Albula glossodonta TaxID=121402 RepID=A0A8T2NUV0_9TELE|nr:hypothetical protein JZ751_015238 [Albula glossodonta]